MNKINTYIIILLSGIFYPSESEIIVNDLVNNGNRSFLELELDSEHINFYEFIDKFIKITD